MSDNIEEKLQQLYKQINDIVPTDIQFDRFALRVDRSGATIYRSADNIIFAQNKIFFDIQSKYSPGIVLDIGANIGFSTLVFSRYFTSAKIYSIEANKYLIDIIKYNIDQNNMKNVEIVNKAVGDHPVEKISFQINNIMSVDSRVSGLTENYETCEIEQTSIDALMADIGYDENRSVFIKIDTQGYEEKVIKGAHKTLKTLKKYCIMMEFAPYWLKESNTDPESLLRYLCTNYNVCEWPAQSSFYHENIDSLQKKIIKEQDITRFINYTTGLRKNGKGWCDLMIFKNP